MAQADLEPGLSGSVIRMMQIIRDAFVDVHVGYSSDRVIADPALNLEFIAACRNRGLQHAEEDLNRNLLNLRKRGELDVKTTRETRFNDDEYRFSAEIAIRHLERRDQITLDDVLVDRRLAIEFDSICVDLAPGYSSLEYRWSALRLRKTRGLPPEIISHAIPDDMVHLLKCSEVDPNTLPTAAGVYILFSRKATLYVGEAANLRTRLKKHLEHSDNKMLAQWFWQEGIDSSSLELHVLSENVSTKTRKALESELIRSRKPLFNILGRLE